MTEETKYEANKDKISARKAVSGLVAVVAGVVILGSLGGCAHIRYEPYPPLEQYNSHEPYQQVSPHHR